MRRVSSFPMFGGHRPAIKNGRSCQETGRFYGRLARWASRAADAALTGVYALCPSYPGQFQVPGQLALFCKTPSAPRLGVQVRSHDPGDHAAIHLDARPGDIGRLFRRQECDERAHLFGLTNAPQRHATTSLLDGLLEANTAPGGVRAT